MQTAHNAQFVMSLLSCILLRGWSNDQRPTIARGVQMVWQQVCLCGGVYYKTWMETLQSLCTYKTFSLQAHISALNIISWCPPTSCLQHIHTEVTAVKAQWNHTPGNAVSSLCFAKRYRERFTKIITCICVTIHFPTNYSSLGKKNASGDQHWCPCWLFWVNSQSPGWSSNNTEWMLVGKRCARHWWKQKPRIWIQYKQYNNKFQDKYVSCIIPIWISQENNCNLLFLALNMLDRITEIFLRKFQEFALKTFNKKNFFSKKHNISECISTSYVRCPLGQWFSFCVSLPVWFHLFFLRPNDVWWPCLMVNCPR